MPTSDMMQIWAGLAGGTAATELSLPDADDGDGSTVVEQRFDSDPPVVLLTIQGGGHTEPSPSQRHRRLWTAVAGPQNGDIESIDVIWRFFEELLR